MVDLLQNCQKLNFDFKKNKMITALLVTLKLESGLVQLAFLKNLHNSTKNSNKRKCKHLTTIVFDSLRENVILLRSVVTSYLSVSVRNSKNTMSVDNHEKLAKIVWLFFFELNDRLALTLSLKPMFN